MIDKYENTLPLFAQNHFSCKAIYKLAMEYGGIVAFLRRNQCYALKADLILKDLFPWE